MIKLFLYDLALPAKIIRKSGVTDVLVLLASLELAVLLVSLVTQKCLTKFVRYHWLSLTIILTIIDYHLTITDYNWLSLIMKGYDPPVPGFLSCSVNTINSVISVNSVNSVSHVNILYMPTVKAMSTVSTWSHDYPEDRPLANDDPEGPASCKWSSEEGRFLANYHLEGPDSCKWSSRGQQQ